MKKLDELHAYHAILDNEIDNFEKRLTLPNVETEKVISEMKKQRLNVRDEILKLEKEIQSAHKNY